MAAHVIRQIREARGFKTETCCALAAPCTVLGVWQVTSFIKKPFFLSLFIIIHNM